MKLSTEVFIRSVLQSLRTVVRFGWKLFAGDELTRHVCCVLPRRVVESVIDQEKTHLLDEVCGLVANDKD